MNFPESKVLRRRLIPEPVSTVFSEGSPYLLQNQCAITISVSGKKDLRKKVEALCQQYWNILPKITQKESSAAKKCEPEGYQLNISAKTLSVTARDWKGISHAFKTLRQLAEAVRGTERVSGYLLAPCKIKDYPAVAFRGIHICIFPETPIWDVEKQIRLAAYYKFNYAVIECWGIFPFESHPEICWNDKKLDRKELKRLVKLGKEIGITLIPQFNILGHAAGSRNVTGKHAILDYKPELQPLFEPEGWTWCISSPIVRELLTDLVLELHDFFENPPFFHIGCDEAHDMGSCFECRKHELKDLLLDHLLYFHSLFKQRKTRLIMWHDMLIEMNDERWKGYIACAVPEQKLANLYQELPKDIIIADWQYFYDFKSGKQPEWPTTKFFKKEKFDVLTCPWKDVFVIESLGKMAKKEKIMGFLETTWHISHDKNFLNTYLCSAYAAWNPEVTQIEFYNAMIFIVFSYHVRHVIWDMKVQDYEKTGTSQYQMDPGHHPHQLA